MSAPLASLLWQSLRVYQVFGANTEVGKTVVTTLLCKSAKRYWENENVSYLKPVSTGPLVEADDRHVKTFAPGVDCHTLFQYGTPVSPHLAAEGSKIPSDQSLLAKCREHAARCAKAGKGWLFMEMAGGVHSPGPSGTTQAELFAPLRVPVILVGDSKLGGISQTIASFEALRNRGYDIQSILLFEHSVYQNHMYLSEYFSEKYKISVMSMVRPPARDGDSKVDAEAMREYYKMRIEEGFVENALQLLEVKHNERLKKLSGMAARAHKTIWYPFTQHEHLPAQDIMTIDSAHGDYFQTFRSSASTDNTENDGALQASFDGSASWWTQGLGHGNSQLTLAAAYAAGRYGHVLFPGAVHEPALELAEYLIACHNSTRVSTLVTRVFYSDNGSTATEVAVKMGLRAARLRYGWRADDKIGILGLRGGYHGDTMGAMDCAEPCVYNENIEWYEGKGYWFDYPTVINRMGRWWVDPPEGMESSFGRARWFGSLPSVFDWKKRERDGDNVIYEQFIIKKLKGLKAQGRKFGALILEPIILGAGGMAFVDPLFQRTLVNVIRDCPDLFADGPIEKPVLADNPDEESSSSKNKAWSGLPIIFDEVFTGLYRLGRFTPSSFLGVEPDIVVNAKLLTGGLLPLSTTCATESIFDAFRGSSKAEALLHGHSYTAHPIGCQVGLEAVRTLHKMEMRGVWGWARQAWRPNLPPPPPHMPDYQKPFPQVWSIWPPELVDDLTMASPRVAGVWALGSVLAIHLTDLTGGAGYSSTAALVLRDALARGDTRGGDNGPWNIHARVLGNVLYLMTGQTTTREGVQQIWKLLLRTLNNLDSVKKRD